MRNRLRHLNHDERGVALIYVGAGFMAFFSAAALAIDVGMLMTARSQAQNAADAGALAGAVALALNDFDDRSPSSPAVQAAITTAVKNGVIGEAVSVTAPDVTFPAAPDGTLNRVRVDVYRTGSRLNPLSTLLGPLLGVDTADMRAAATAEAAPANAVTCVRPFIIPDKWTENQTPPWSFNTTFDRYNNRGDVIPNADVYTPGAVRYDMTRTVEQGGDKGRIIKLRADNGGNPEPTMYYSWKMPDDIGANYYEDNIKKCNQRSVSPGVLVQQEPGAMVGPTNSGIDELIDQDPTAHWDGNTVKSPLGRTPRIFPIPLFDPDVYQANKTTGRNATLKVVGFIGIFVEKRVGSEVHGRIVPLLGTIDPNAGPAPEGSTILAVRLVQ